MRWRGLAVLFPFAACASQHARPRVPLESGPAYPVLHSVMVPKRISPGGQAVGTTECGERLFLLERAQGSTRVGREDGQSFFIDDAELAGSLTANVRCEPALVTHDERVSDAEARSRLPPSLREVDAWPTFDDELPSRFYQRDEHDSSCVEFRLGGEALESDTVRWGFHRMGLREVMLTGPTIRGLRGRETDEGLVVEPDPSGEISWLCMKNLFIAHHAGGQWDLVPFPVDVHAEGISAYAAGVAVRWFATRAACEHGLPRKEVAKIPFSHCG